MQVPDAILVKAAAQKAVLANAKGALRSRSMHAELVFNLSGSKHVSDFSLAVASSVFGMLMSRKGLHTQSIPLPKLIRPKLISNYQLSCSFGMLWRVRGDMTRFRLESHLRSLGLLAAAAMSWSPASMKAPQM